MLSNYSVQLYSIHTQYQFWALALIPNTQMGPGAIAAVGIYYSLMLGFVLYIHTSNAEFHRDAQMFLPTPKKNISFPF